MPRDELQLRLIDADCARGLDQGPWPREIPQQLTLYVV